MIADFLVDAKRFSPLLLDGLWVTLVVSFATLICSTLLGAFWEALRLSGSAVLAGVSTSAITLIRSVPMMVQVFFAYFALPEIGIDMSPIVAGTLALSMGHSAYMAENFRLAIQSIDKGQLEAAQSMGMSRIRTFSRVIVPQALKSALPPYGNSAIMILKDSSLCAVITVPELTRQAQLLSAETFKTMNVFTLAALMYAAICIPTALLVRYSEKHLAGAKTGRAHD